MLIFSPAFFWWQYYKLISGNDRNAPKLALQIQLSHSCLECFSSQNCFFYLKDKVLPLKCAQHSLLVLQSVGEACF